MKTASQAKRKPLIRWTMREPDGFLCVNEILTEKRYHAVDMLPRMSWMDVRGHDWNTLRREGWRCVKVRIEEVDGQ